MKTGGRQPSVSGSGYARQGVGETPRGGDHIRNCKAAQEQIQLFEHDSDEHFVDPDTLAVRVAALEPKGRRTLVAVAGPPGAGKSTFAGALVSALGKTAALVPMDGFHIDNRILETRGLLPRKGAPETFDAAGFLTAVNRLATEDEVMIPAFDRTRDIAIAGATVVSPGKSIVVVEGNYLLLKAPPWHDLKSHWDFSVFLDVPTKELRRRLVHRWQDYGLCYESAILRAESNDLPNARLVNDQSARADAVVRSR